MDLSHITKNIITYEKRWVLRKLCIWILMKIEGQTKKKRCVLSKLWIWFVIELKEKEIWRKMMGFEEVVYLDFNENKRTKEEKS